MSSVIEWLRAVGEPAMVVGDYALIECLQSSNHREGKGNPSMWVNTQAGHAACFTCQTQLSAKTLADAIRRLTPERVPEQPFPTMERDSDESTVEYLPDKHVPVLNIDTLPTLFDSLLVYRNVEGSATHLMMKKDSGRIQLAYHDNGQWRAGFTRYPDHLFQIELLTQTEKRTEQPRILVLENEFDALSAQQVFMDTHSNAIAVSWCGTTSEWYKADFDALYGQEVILWPNPESKLVFKGIAEHMSKCARRLWVLDQESIGFRACVGSELDPCEYIHEHAVPFDTDFARELRNPANDAAEN